MWLSKAKNRIGYRSQMRTIFLTSTLRLPLAGLHRSNKYLNLIGIDNLEYTDKYIFISKDEIEWAKEKLKKQNKSFFSINNIWLLGYLYSLPSIILFTWSGGIIGIISIIVVWSLSNFLLEALNFMGHYGLIREDGKPVEHKHSWDNDNLFTSWFFIEIGRQGDHHVRGETYFWELDEVGAPNYQIGYFTLFLLTLVPPLFRAYTQKYLDNWDKNQASEAERNIAKDYYQNTKHYDEKLITT